MATLTQGGARNAARSAGGWIESAGRVGYAARGLVYVLVGALAVKAAVGSGGATEGQKDVLARLSGGPFGEALLAAVAVGLFGYALWRLVEGIVNPDGLGKDAKGIAKRGSRFVSAVLHASLGASAVGLLVGRSGGSSEGSADGMTARLMEQPFGRVLVALVGVAVIGGAVSQLARAHKGSFMRNLDTARMLGPTRRWVERAGRIGYAARGVVFAIVGVFLMVAAVRAQPQQARGLGGALSTLAAQPFGQALLAVVAAGLVAFGVFAFCEARYRRMSVG